jgi:heat shock protein HtpX
VRTNTTLQTLLLGGALLGVAVLTGWQLMGSWAILLMIGFFAAVGISIHQTEPKVRLRGSRPIRYFEAPELIDTVETLSRRAGLQRPPELHYVRSRTLNAATVGGSGRATVLVTDGLLSSLSRRELEGVLAHEIAHVKNNDLSLFRFAEIVRQATLLFARAGWMLVLFALPVVLASGGLSGGALLTLVAAPIASWLLQLALLRTREFAADVTAAHLTGDPEGLAYALERIESVQRGLFEVLLPTRPDAEGSLFRTHPQTTERVARLRTLRAGTFVENRRPAGQGAGGIDRTHGRPGPRRPSRFRGYAGGTPLTSR